VVHNPSIKLDIPEASLLIDLNGIKWDLTLVSEWCDSYLVCFDRQFRKAPGDGSAFRAYATAIPVNYARCFKSGVRRALKAPLLNLLSEQEMDCHKEFISIRDKHIAHSVNDFEMGDVVVSLNPPDLGKQINLVTVSTHTIMALRTDSFTLLKSVIGKLLKWLESEINREQARIRKIVEERYSLEELYNLSESQQSGHFKGNVHKSRRRK
jgi:hypothetical protein